MRQNIHAFTQIKYVGGYPGYISVNKEDDGKYSVAVRSEGCGGNQLSQLDMDRDQLEALANSIKNHLGAE